MSPFGVAPSFTLEVYVEPPKPLDPSSNGPVRLVSIIGGRVSGSLVGVILPGGADWQTIRADGGIEIEARYFLELLDGTRIDLQSRGRREGPTGGFWSTIWLSCANPTYTHLNKMQFVAWGARNEKGVVISAYALPETVG